MRTWLALLLVGCTAPTIEVEATKPSTTRDVTVETWPIGLVQRNDRGRVARRDLVAKAIAASEVDALCLTEVAFDDDVAAIRAAAAQRFPYVAHERFDRRAKTDDRGMDGRVVVMPTDPPCKASDAATFDALLACIKDKCAAADGSVDTGCALLTCGGGGAEETRCSLCAQTAIMSRPLAEMRAPCFEDPRGELIFDGRVEVMLLSRWPLRDVRVVPTLGTVARAGVATAIADTEHGPLGLACLQIPRAGPGLYRGPFLPDNMAIASNGYVEFGLQAVRLTEAIYPMSVPTIVLGQPQFAWSVGKTGKITSECAFNANFAMNFTMVTTPDLEPMTWCTECTGKEDPQRSGTVLPMTLVHHIPSFELVSVERTHLGEAMIGAAHRVHLRF